MSKTIDQLIKDRGDLVWGCDADGAFPGSKKWLAANAATKALAAFDAAHPEVLAEIQRRHSESLGLDADKMMGM